jgi:hypothetical protein
VTAAALRLSAELRDGVTGKPEKEASHV